MRARQNALRRSARAHGREREGERARRVLLFICYLFANARATEAAPGTRDDPAGDRFEKLLIVLFWKGVPRSHPSLSTTSSAPHGRRGASFMPAGRNRTTPVYRPRRTNAPLSISRVRGTSLLPRRGASQWVETEVQKAESRVNSFVE